MADNNIVTVNITVKPSREHRWSGWPGAWCLDCGVEDPHEEALATGDYIEVPDADSPMGFRFAFPNLVMTPCPCPNAGHFDPYRKKEDER